MKKAIIFGGFLGSGKTTFILQLARHITSKLGTDKNNVVIIENEIGEIGVDDLILGSDGMQVKNLFAGCACCSMAGETEYVVKKIIEDMDPEYIILEATGLAYPKNIKDNLTENPGIDCEILCLADASRWLRLVIPMENLLSTQLEGADHVILSKIDKVDSAMLEAVKASIRKFNGETDIIPINSLEPIDSMILDEIIE